MTSITLITILSALSPGNADFFDRGSPTTALSQTAIDYMTDSVPPLMDVLSDHLTFSLPTILMAASSPSSHHGLLAALVTFLQPSASQSTKVSCSAVEQCLDDTIVADEFYANAPRSAALASVTAEDHLYCSGARSCESAVLLSIGAYLWCGGYASCADVSSINLLGNAHSQGWIGFVLGSDAILDSNIVVSGNAEVECSAAHGCVGGNFTVRNGKNINGYGAHAFTNATLHCATSACVFRFAAHYAGYGATVYCPAGSRCTVQCYAETGCYGLRTDVEAGATLVVNGLEEYAQFIITSPSDLATVPVDPWDSGILSILDAVEKECNTYAGDAQGMVFDDSPADSITDADQYQGPVCCRGKHKCQSRQIVGTASNQPVLCGAEAACRASTINVQSRVLCVAYSSCNSGTSINTTQEVYCTGSEVCISAEISAPVVYCSGGHKSCGGAHITYSDDFVVFMIGQWAADDAHIECPEGATCTVHCQEHQTGDDSSDPRCDKMTLTGNVIVNYDVSVPVVLPFDTTAPTKEPSAEPTSIPTTEPTEQPTVEPTAVPSTEPTAPPSSEPTADPTCGAQRTLNWDDLLLQGADYEALPEVSYELDVDQSTDTLSVDVFLPYLGSSQRDEDSAANLGTTYFISFRAFSSDDAIAIPGNCDNRDADAFVNKSWAESWRFDAAGATTDSLGSAQFLAYGPSDFWSVSPDGRYPDCVERVHYAAEFALPDLLSCADAAGAPSIEVVTNDAWMNVSGSLFVSVLSPLTMSFESSTYFKYQLLSAPFSLSIAKSVYLLDAIDTFVFSASPLAVYREAEGHYVMLLLTESAEFVALEGLSVLDPTMQSSVAAEEADCIAEQNYICSQVWVVDITNVACPFSLDGDYAFQFTAVCDDDGSAAECEQFVQDNGDSVTLSTQLSFADTMCDPEVWTLQYDGAVSFYADDSFEEQADADAAYRSLTDRVFVELRVDIPNSDANFTLYDVELYNVWLCTSPSELTLDADAVDSTGCFDSRVDGLSPYHIIKNYDATLSSGAAHEETDALNTARFSFVVPAGVAEGAVYIEMQALLTLRSADEQTRRRLLTDEQEESSQLQLFMGSITVSDDGVEEEPASHGEAHEPSKETSGDNLLVVVVILALLLAVCGVGALAVFIRARRKTASSETSDAVVLSQVVTAKAPSDAGEIAK